MLGEAKRRNSFCTSELPSAVMSFDSLFGILRVGLSSDELNSLRRASSSEPTFKMVEPPQVDGSFEGEKAEQARKKEKKRRKGKKKKKKDQGKGLPQGSNGANLGSAEHLLSNNATTSCPLVTDEAPPGDSDLIGGLSETFYPDTSSSHTVRHPSRQGEDHAEPDQSASIQIADAPVTCHLHGRNICRFNLRCCVHHSTTGCSCPPRWSCCCIHHSGDCCNCAFASVSSYLDEHAFQLTPDGSSPTLERMSSANYASPIAASEHHSTPTETLKDSIDSLSAHLFHCLEASKFCDFQIILRSSKDIFIPIVFHTHKAVISRSRTVANLLKSSIHEESNNEIVAIGSDNFCMIKGFEYALQHLYGRPLLTAAQLRLATLSTYGYSENNAGSIQFSLIAAMADFAICYAASGAFFQQETVIKAGIKLAIDLINWGTVECVLYFGCCATKSAVTLDHTARGQETGGYEIVEDLERRASQIVSSALEFVTRDMGKNFTLYTKAQSKSLPNRIPESLQTVPGSVLPNPKLAEVKFGSFASLNEEKPSQEIEIPSAMLICLPYTQLEEMFRIMEARNILSGNLAQAVIAEREARRLQALRVFAKQGTKDELSTPDEVRELGYRESVAVKVVGLEEQSSAIALSREWVGLAVVEETVSTPSVKRVLKKYKKRKR
ncbi:hypothetical protein BDV28DRAFT_159645 [Aspergillus coremiiformis]|uniref:BTB domain-containing protein n=1 Tax=Aspergillus coremiiformis TaxID=138285 RepID=A0A5N6YY70_9EURO|nr:hypothetical protein BDV28DRAFT_159645 [Aspergillus coremiiformis]